MPKPTVNHNVEHITHSGLHENSTLSLAEFKAFTGMVNQFIEAYPELCNTHKRLWTNPYWRKIAAKFIARFGKYIWRPDRESVIQLPPPAGEQTTQKDDESSGGRNAATGNAIGHSGAREEARETRPATDGEKEQKFAREDALIYPDDVDTISFLSFNMLKLEAAKRFTRSGGQRERPGKGYKLKRKERDGSEGDDYGDVDDEEEQAEGNSSTPVKQPYLKRHKKELLGKKWKKGDPLPQQSAATPDPFETLRTFGLGPFLDTQQQPTTPQRSYENPGEPQGLHSTSENPYFLEDDDEDVPVARPAVDPFKAVREGGRSVNRDEKGKESGKKPRKFPDLKYSLPSMTDDSAPSINPTPRKMPVNRKLPTSPNTSEQVVEDSHGAQASEGVAQSDQNTAAAEPAQPTQESNAETGVSQGAETDSHGHPGSNNSSSNKAGPSENAKLLEKFQARKEKNSEASPNRKGQASSVTVSPGTAQKKQELKKVDFLFNVTIHEIEDSGSDAPISNEAPKQKTKTAREPMLVEMPSQDNGIKALYEAIKRNVSSEDIKMLKKASRVSVGVFQKDGSTKISGFSIRGDSGAIHKQWYDLLSAVVAGAHEMKKAGIDDERIRWADQGQVDADEITVDLHFE